MEFPTLQRDPGFSEGPLKSGIAYATARSWEHFGGPKHLKTDEDRGKSIKIDENVEKELKIVKNRCRSKEIGEQSVKFCLLLAVLYGCSAALCARSKTSAIV